MHGVLLKRHLRQDAFLSGSTSHFIWIRQNTRRGCHQDICHLLPATVDWELSAYDHNKFIAWFSPHAFVGLGPKIVACLLLIFRAQAST